MAQVISLSMSMFMTFCLGRLRVRCATVPEASKRLYLSTRGFSSVLGPSPKMGSLVGSAMLASRVLNLRFSNRVAQSPIRNTYLGDRAGLRSLFEAFLEFRRSSFG